MKYYANNTLRFCFTDIELKHVAPRVSETSIMEITNVFPNVSNVISVAEILRDNLESSHNNTSVLDVPGDVVFFICALGLPGNLLVIAVYIWAMTSSMRVYMFSLAASDAAVCVCGIVLAKASLDVVSRHAVTYFTNVSIAFSASLLVFVSIERLITVRRPHSFSVRALRAKHVVITLVAAAVIYKALVTVAQLRQYTTLVGMSELVCMSAAILIMVTCYALIAVSLLKKITFLNNRIGTSPYVEPGHSSGARKESAKSGPNTTAVTYVHSNVVAISRVTIYPIVGDKTAAKKTKTYKNVLLLANITFVFIVTWLPHYMVNVGVPMHSEVRGIFVLNSAVNPIIYCFASAMYRDDVRHFYSHKLSRCHR